MLGIADKRKARMRELSYGEKQWVAITRALAANPEVLFCDETTNSLDPKPTRSILVLIRDLKQRLKITVVLITHQMEVVRAICQEVAVMDAVNIVKTGSIAAVLDSPKTAVAREMFYVS